MARSKRLTLAEKRAQGIKPRLHKCPLCDKELISKLARKRHEATHYIGE
jgi:hypothetical protein